MSANILISLEPRHAQNILSGEKKVELRRRAPRVSPGTVIWMYAKMPEGSVVGHATVKKIHEASPQYLWKRFKNQVGVSKAEFFEYFSCRATGVAIELQDTRRLENPVSLKQLRSVDESFQPPQFFKHLHVKEMVTDAVTAAK
ncbi:putative transcriptional regulator [Xanthomonas arboricola]|uniref:ASCH domain-containing protein n=1 Tax=Xanthomonas TaxID=338 RepID=UPI0011B0BA78|nr:MULTISPECIES: ASCH domain-containing protein [Xanthomonas]MBB5736420.1 putative transcriptional regulator [Xanthomonas sp. CFBP 8152]NJC03202.1 putative transcriptional regulator [Xanthomonas arboricola]